MPRDAGGDNRYEATIQPGERANTVSVTVRVQDRDEPGRAEPRRPAPGEPVTMRLTDPDLADGADAAPAMRWERWRSPGTWQAIPEAAWLSYTPVAADAGRHLRAALRGSSAC